MKEEVKVGEKAQEEGYKLRSILSVLELPKSTWYHWQNKRVDYTEKYAYLLNPIDKVIEDHPEYGYRRIKVQLEREFDNRINHKVIQRLLREWNLRLKRSVQKSSKSRVRKAIESAGYSTDLVNRRDDIKPFEVCITDFTEIRFASGSRKVQLIPIVCYCSKMVYGWAIGKRKDTEVALKAWKRTF